MAHQHVRASNPTFSAKSRSSREIIRRVVIYLKPYKLLALATVSCAVLSLGFAFVFPQLLRFVIDNIIVKKQLELLAPVMMGLLASFLLRDVFNSLRIWVNNTLEQNVVFDMRRELYARLQRLPVNYFDQRASGDLMTRVIEDVNNVERLLIDGIEQGTVSILSILGALIFMFISSPSLALVALVPLPLLAGGALCYTLTAHKRYRCQREAASGLNALLMDNLQGVREIKAFGREVHEEEQFERGADALRQGTLGIMRVWAVYSPAMSFAAALGMGLVLWIGGRQVITGDLSLGQLMGFVLYLSFFYEPIGKLHGLNQILQSARASGERVFDILDSTPEGKDGRRVQALQLPLRGEVVFENVDFCYQSDRSILHEINLKASPSEVIALVGPTGAGKSTLVNLLPAFYEPTGGRITLDGQEISGITLESLRAQISLVSQEPFLFNGTVRENVLYGKLDATQEELFAATRAANCHEFISRLPQGYDSTVGERGVKLSVGEKQRISIARALLKNTPLLILDEATASVDTATEKLIQEALERLMANRTSFVIAHRLSTIRRADQILVLAHGKIVERGTHEELVAQDGVYAQLARIQNTTFIEEGFEKIQA